MYKRIKLNKNYVNTFNTIFKEDNENAYQDIARYVDEVDNIEFKNKGRIFKLFFELKEGYNYENTLTELDFKELFYEKDKVDNQKIGYNSDTFVWLVVLLAKAYKCEKMDVIDALMDKMQVHEEILKNRVEYQLCLSTAKSLKKEDDLGIEFLKKLIEGEYADYQYDTRLIGIYKKIATALLAFDSQELDDYEKNDVKLLCNSLVGTFILQDLGLFEEYSTMELNLDENINEEKASEEVSEEKAEEAADDSKEETILDEAVDESQEEKTLEENISSEEGSTKEE